MRIHLVENGIAKDKRKLIPRRLNGKFVGYLLTLPPFKHIHEEADVTYIIDRNKIKIYIEIEKR